MGRVPPALAILASPHASRGISLRTNFPQCVVTRGVVTGRTKRVNPPIDPLTPARSIFAQADVLRTIDRGLRDAAYGIVRASLAFQHRARPPRLGGSSEHGQLPERRLVRRGHVRAQGAQPDGRQPSGAAKPRSRRGGVLREGRQELLRRRECTSRRPTRSAPRSFRENIRRGTRRDPRDRSARIPIRLPRSTQH